MQIFCEVGSKYEPNCLKITKQNNSFTSTHYEQSVDDILLQEKESEKKKILFLDEEKFRMYHFDVLIHREQIMAIQDVKTIINEKLLWIYKQHGQNNSFLFYMIEWIFVNWEEKEYIIWEKWQIFFKLSFYFLKPEIQQIYQIKFPTMFSEIDIYPSSLFTTRFIKKKLQKKSFFLLYIEDNVSKLLHINNGFYRTIENVNMWTNMLKETYADNNIVDLFYATDDQLDSHPLVKDIVYQSVDFFTQMLAKRLRQYIDQENDLILISSLTKNIFFQKQFNKWYNHFINWFILPFSHSNILDTYWRKRESEELNILTFLNSQKDFKKIIWK